MAINKEITKEDREAVEKMLEEDEASKNTYAMDAVEVGGRKKDAVKTSASP
jgi:hypothetical protein